MYHYTKNKLLLKLTSVIKTVPHSWQNIADDHIIIIWFTINYKSQISTKLPESRFDSNVVWTIPEKQ